VKIVILEAFHTNPGDQSWEAIEALGDVTIYEKTLQEQVLERALEADILVTNKVLITDELLSHLPQLKLIHQLATGTDNIDKDAAKARGIEVNNAVGYSTHAVAQHAFALMLHLTSHVAIHNSEVKEGGWTKSGDWCHMIKTPRKLSGKTLGIVGFGKIAQAVAKIGLAFGMEIMVVSKHATQSQYPEVKIVDLPQLAKNSDFVSLHSPLTPESKGIINTDFLSQMKPTAFLINTARGGLIMEDDLTEALKSKTIAGAGLDVLANEPPKADNPLLALSNCIITPHIAWTSFEARKRLIEIVANNIKNFIEKTK
jgi:glycerate dehydrogenase